MRWIFLPSRSPDLNIVEEIWGILDQLKPAHGEMTADDKEAMLQDIWMN